MGAYKRNVVVVIKMGAYIHGVLVGAYYPDFTLHCHNATAISNCNLRNKSVLPATVMSFCWSLLLKGASSGSTSCYSTGMPVA